MRSAVDVILCDFCRRRVEVELPVMPPHWQSFEVRALPDGVVVLADACDKCAAVVKKLIGEGSGATLSLKGVK